MDGANCKKTEKEMDNKLFPLLTLRYQKAKTTTSDDTSENSLDS